MEESKGGESVGKETNPNLNPATLVEVGKVGRPNTINKDENRKNHNENGIVRENGAFGR